jgi:hypothetical protein
MSKTSSLTALWRPDDRQASFRLLEEMENFPSSAFFFTGFGFLVADIEDWIVTGDFGMPPPDHCLAALRCRKQNFSRTPDC